MPETAEGLHVIVIGNPQLHDYRQDPAVLRIFGPYKTREEAGWEADRIDDKDFWLLPLESLDTLV